MDLLTARGRSLLARVAMVALLAAPPAQADLFSPGELSRAHSNLLGLSNCASCHPSGKRLSAERCLSCHTELQPRLDAQKGFHGRLPASERDSCQTCHHEHMGPDYALIDWGPLGKKRFDHTRTGWPLVGAHRPLACKECHKVEWVSSPEIQLLLASHPERDTFLGAPQACGGCHFDEHRGQENKPCAACHDARAWKPAPGFDHAQTRYPLLGKHRQVSCERCHPKVKAEAVPEEAPLRPRAETFTRFHPIEHRACSNCHADPHQGRFGARCESCHAVEGWKGVRHLDRERSFHAKTAFPLEGRHQETACRACHGPFPGVPAKLKGLAHDSCRACHADAHLGQLTAKKGSPPPDCSACHSEEGFETHSFSVEAHAATRYPLEEAHRAVRCVACHREDPALAKRIPATTLRALLGRGRPARFDLTRFELPRPQSCASCHADVHAGQFAKREGGCTGCHRLTSFADTTFDHGRDSRFPLVGKHKQTPCQGCHPSSGRGAVKYKGVPLACDGCHADVHAGQLALAPGNTSCQRCHRVDDWRPVVFEHRPPFTDFLLDGKHQTARCDSCHPPVSVAAGVSARKYRGLPTSCEGCHEDYHRGAFQGFTP